jgi:hypothetical protein
MRKKTAKASKGSILTTPGGPRPRGHVHRVAPGQRIRVDSTGKGTAHPSSPGAFRPEGSPEPQNQVVTPGGTRLKTHVHHVPPGHCLRLSKDRVAIVRSFDQQEVRSVPRLKRRQESKSRRSDRLPGTGPGWVTSGRWRNGTPNPLSLLATTWEVPPPPRKDDGQTVYLFNGWQNDDHILQPVLQWGQSEAGGGSSWSVASWFVDSSKHAFYTHPIAVNPGDVLRGVMTLTGQDADGFSYRCEFIGIPGTILDIDGASTLFECVVTLEAYGIKSCSDYPATDRTRFHSVSIRTGPAVPVVDFVPDDRVVDCGQGTYVASQSAVNGEGDIYYNSRYVGYFGKWFNAGHRNADFQYMDVRYIGGSPNQLPSARLVPCSLAGTPATDFVVFRASDGYFGKWFNNALLSPDFEYIAPPRYVGGAPGALPGAQLIPCHLENSPRTDFIVFRSADGHFGKWFNDGNHGPDFEYVAPPRYIGGAPGALSGAQLIPCDLDGDGRTDFVVFRPSDGYFAKWFNDGNHGPDFEYIAPHRYVGGAPGVLPGAQLIPCHLENSPRTDFVVFRPSDGYFGKWFNDGNDGPDFEYVAPPRYIGGAPGALSGAQLIPCDLDGDGRSDFVVFRPSDGYFAKWFNDGNRGPDFQYMDARYIGGAPSTLPGAQLIPCSLAGNAWQDLVVFKPS